MGTDQATLSGGKRRIGTMTKGGTDRPLFTLITAVFNDAVALERTVLSVHNQNYNAIEYIVIDGGSTDGTLDVIRKYEHLIDCWVSEPDKGVYDAFNKACRLSTGDWTIFLGAGDVLYNAEVLTRVAETVRCVGEDTQIVYGKVSVPYGTLNPKLINRPWIQMRGRWRGGRPMLPHHQGVFHRRRLLSAEEPFDISYRIAADSKVIYRSIKRVPPVFVDAIITSAMLGGVSTGPKYFMATANEILRINREFGFRNYGHQLWFYLKSVAKTAIYEAGGEELSKACIDRYRRLTGRESKWAR